MSWTGLIGAGMRLGLSRRIAALSDDNRWARHAGRIQRRQLRRLLSTARATEFGRAHDFDRLRRLSDDELLDAYRRAIPVAGYDQVKPTLDRMRLGAELDVTWPGRVMDWAQTSGTTSGDKYMPVSRDLLRHNAKAALDTYAHAARFGCSLTSMFSGKVLFLGGSTDLSVDENGVRTGDLSGVVTRMIRWPLSAAALPPKDIALMDDWSEKIERMASLCLDEDVRCLNGMPSWSLTLFERMLAEARRRGREISTLREIWPNLRLFVHGGVKYDPFERRIRSMWSGDSHGEDIQHRVEVYAASEAFVAIQDRAGDPGLRLNIDHGVFYEFVPLERIDEADPPAFACDEVEPNWRYVVVVSTCAGLWRYSMGDVVEFDTVPPHGPPRLRIVGRSRQYMNAFGENIIAEHVERAVAEAAQRVEVNVGEFTSAPIFPSESRAAAIELAIEWPTEPGCPQRGHDRFEDKPARSGTGVSSVIDAAHGRDGRVTEEESSRRRFAEVFDASLRRQSNDYAAKRRGGAGMAEPTITPLPFGAFHRWLEAQGKLGGQHKCPRCASDRAIIDAVLNTVEPSTPVG